MCAAALAVPAPHSASVILLGLLGAGLGVYTPANNAEIMAALPSGDAATGGGMVNMTRGIGTALIMRTRQFAKLVFAHQRRRLAARVPVEAVVETDARDFGGVGEGAWAVPGVSQESRRYAAGDAESLVRGV